MPGRERRPSAEEKALWREMTGDVKPLGKRPAPEAPAAPPAKPPQAIAAKPRESAQARKPRPQALSHGAAPGVDRRTAERLRRGQLEIQARLDLHGMTQAEAHGRLAAFIEAHQASGRRCVLVVTGKGARREEGGVLREAVPRWLNEPGLRARILAFCHAQPKDGGEGALYVLLKRLR